MRFLMAMILLCLVQVKLHAAAGPDPSGGSKHIYLKEKYGPDSCSKFTMLSSTNQEVFKILPAYADGFRITIYDRYGTVVYASANISEGWDGHIDDSPAPEGVYYYMVQYKTWEKGKRVTKKLSGGIYVTRTVVCG